LRGLVEKVAGNTKPHDVMVARMGMLINCSYIVLLIYVLRLWPAWR